MTRAFPYLRPPADVVETGPWSRPGPDGTIELPSALPDWDYSTVLTLQRTVRVDGMRTRELSGLAPETALALAVRWSASSSMLRGRAWKTAVPPQDGVEITIEFELDGRELGGNLELVTALTLDELAPSLSLAAPSRPGSVLWSDRFAVMLQGDAVLFPLAIADFNDLPYPTRASWYLDVGQDLEAAAMGSILLLGNERRELVVSALAAAAAPSDVEQAVLSFLRTDVLRTLVERAVTHEDFDEEYEYPAGSLGAVLRALVRNVLPDVRIEELRRERQNDPAFFASRIQDVTNMLAVR